MTPPRSTALGWTSAELAADPSWTVRADAQLEPVIKGLMDWAALLSEPAEALARGGWAAAPSSGASLLRRWCEPLADQLQQGRGVVRLTGLQGLKEEELRLLFLAIGLELGPPDRTYGLLYGVRDSGASYRDQPIPVSQTSGATGMHTDSSQRRVHPRWVGLACVCPAASGGASAVGSAQTIHAHLLRSHPSVVERLRQPFIRDLVTPGEKRTPRAIAANAFPIFSGPPRDPILRYMRFWIEKGQSAVGQPLRPEALADLDLLDAALNAPQFRHTFLLGPGDLLFIDNHRIAHDRTAYEDDPRRPRRLLRLWLNAPGQGPIPS